MLNKSNDSNSMAKRLHDQPEPEPLAEFLHRFDLELKRKEIALQPDEQARVGLYFYLLDQANRSMNLTGYDLVEDWIDFHLADALYLLNYVLDDLLCALDLPEGASIFDVGSGAGIPGVVIKCIRPNIRLRAVESVKKKAEFIQSVLNKLGRDDAIIAMRAEIAAREPEWREQGDIAMARALGSLPVSMELTAPFVRVGGYVILPRGPVKPEDGGVDRFHETLGCTLSSVHEYRLLRRETPYFIYVYEKIAPTQVKFPRNPGQIKKRPL